MKNSILFSLSVGLLLVFVALVSLTISLPSGANAQVAVDGTITSQDSLDTTFNYMGNLQANNIPANGQHDFEFKLYDDDTAGAQIGPTQVKSNIRVDQGFFTVDLNFGNVFTGATRYLQIGVRRGGPTAQPFTSLLPRQLISPVPYAQWAKNSGGGGTVNKEIWKLFRYDCGGPSYSGCAGFALDATMSPTSFLGFGAPSTQKTIQSVKFLLSQRNVGGGNITATLQILDFAGNVQQNLAAIDMMTVVTGTWITLPITGNPIISPNQHLVFYFAGSNLINPVDFGFDAEAEVY